MDKKINKIFVIIPAYNEERTIHCVINKILKHIPNVIVIDDGSTDNTREEITDLPITILCNDFNQGKDAALLRGFTYAEPHKPSGIITIDADSQHDPDDIPKFLSAVNQHPNHVILGARLIGRQDAPKKNRRANSIADFFISWAAGQHIVDSQSGFRYYPMALLKKHIDDASRVKHFTFESEILINAAREGYTTLSIPIKSFYPSDARASHYHTFRDTLQITAVITKKILTGGLCLPGLLKVLFTRNRSVIKI